MKIMQIAPTYLPNNLKYLYRSCFGITVIVLHDKYSFVNLKPH